MCKLRLAPPRSGPAYTAFPARDLTVRGPVPPCALAYTAAPICGGQIEVFPVGEPASVLEAKLRITVATVQPSAAREVLCADSSGSTGSASSAACRCCNTCCCWGGARFAQRVSS